MDESSSSDTQETSRRWTCEACGCNTNTEADRTCTICGTSNGSSLLRRAGQAARAGLFARSMAARRSFMNEELGLDGYEFWERVDDDVDMNVDDDHETAMALAREVNLEITGVGGGRGDRAVGSRSIAAAARSFGMVGNNREPERLEPEELLRAASDNGSLYQPKWMNPSQIGGRMRTGNGIEVGDGEKQNVAYLPRGAGEGRALRALEAFPRSVPFASFSLTSPNGSSGQERRPRRVFGFKVAFEQPGKEEGKNMEGSHLVGVTTTSFASFSERNALQQSPFFWGIENSGIKYEGARHHSVTEDHRRAQPNYGVELTAADAPRNDENALFGCKQVVTCVADLESRTLTFWRDEDGERKLLGTIVNNLPRGGQLYPIVVPFNAGSTVAITGMSGDPLPLLSSFSIDWKQAQIEKDILRRRELESDRSILIYNGSLSPPLLVILKVIFALYAADGSVLNATGIRLTKIEATRLWYRCGIKLSNLDDVIKAKPQGAERKISFEDFQSILQRIVEDDEKYLSIMALNDPDASDFEVGERVELVEGYERFGDASSGTLLPGDRGTVVEMQNGPSGDRNSIRVIHNSRRWWYQPQALVREGSGLTDSPCVWFLKGILRSHGYDQKTLQPLVGSQVTGTSWQIGDLVIPKKIPRDTQTKVLHGSEQNEAVGKIVFENSTSPSVSSVRARVSGSVLVEFVSQKFADGVSVQTGTSFKELPYSVEKRRVQISRLVHTSAIHGVNINQHESAPPSVQNSNLVLGSEDIDIGTKPMEVEETTKSNNIFTVDDNVQADLKRIVYLDPAAIERVIDDCNKTSMSLTGLFNAGLPRVALEALDHALRKVEESKSDGNLAQAITGLGKLGLLVAEKAFPDECETKTESKLGSASAVESEVTQSQDTMLQASRNLGLETRARPNDADRETALRESSRASRLNSLQQRHRMLLTLMTRARRNEGGSLADLLSREMHGIPSLHMNADAAAALLFSSSEDINNFRELSEDQDSSLGLLGHENARPTVAAPSIACSNSNSRGLQETLLDTVCRKRAPGRPVGAGAESTVQFSSIRDIIDLGVLGNSLPWLTSLLDSVVKKVPTKQVSMRGLPILTSATDEDGMPLLQLAISLGCSHLVVKELIAFGATVGQIEIKAAADNDLPEVLSVLLNYKLYSEGMLDLTVCSSAVSTVVRDAISRQQAQLHELRKEADVFLASYFEKMLEICLLHRQRRQHGESDLCGRAIAGTLVGNAELCALHSRHSTVDRESVRPTSEQEFQNSEGRDSALHASGFMQVFPMRILARSLAERSSNLTILLLLIEDFLCSKGINDAGCGLALLMTLFQRFPPLVESPEIDRYGFVELVASHDALALNRLEELSSRVAKNNSAIDGEHHGDLGMCLVLCPKKHCASVHVTKHASFRCDLCGKGVERGAVMHGCRECDWDACEFCTDKAEGGIVKWKYVRELASTCQELLAQDTHTLKENYTQLDTEWSLMATHDTGPSDDIMDANTLSIRLLQRDPDSLKVLASKLSHRGQLTMHQFLCVILPALHSALMGKSNGKRLEVRFPSAGRRSKKPRVTGFASHAFEGRIQVNEEDRLYFAKEIIKTFVDDLSPGIETTGPPHHRDGTRSRKPYGDDDDDEGSDDGYNEQDANLGTKDEKPKVAQLPELFRRLHQVLSLHEDVGKLASSNIDKTDAGSSRELNALIKPISIALVPGLSAQNKQHKLQTNIITLQAEPLVSVEDISRQVLKSAAMTNAQYVSYCRKLAEDSSVIFERASTMAAAQQPWRIAKILSYNEKGGWHTVRYARSLGEFDNLKKVLLQGSSEIDRLQYDKEDTKLLLVARTFVVIHRGKRAKHLKSPFNMEKLLAEGLVPESDEKNSFNTESCVNGQRVESDFQSSGWIPYTIVSVECFDQEKQYALVSDDGEVLTGVPLNRIRGVDSVEETNILSGPGSRSDRIVTIGRNGDPRAQLSRAFPFLTTRRQESQEEGQGGLENKINKRLLKRTWSALGPIESMSPVGVKAASHDSAMARSNVTSWICDIGGRKYDICVPQSMLERRPSLYVLYKSADLPSPVKVAAPDETTLLSLLYRLFNWEEFEVFGRKPHQIIYIIGFCPSKDSKLTDPRWEGGTHMTSVGRQNAAFTIDSTVASRDDAFIVDECPTENRSRKMVPPMTDSDDENASFHLSVEGFDEICFQCLEILELLAEVKNKMSGWTKEVDSSRSVFVNEELSQKLSKQLENPLCVVGGVAPEWCFSVPTYAPHVFSYTSRKLLLDRVAFGVSRSTLMQQEVKVNVGRLRQRMTSLRARAVELVGEAFSGGAEDPTALQLQADELYGMEEALASRVRASFRAEGWEEKSLQVAKAVVHRDLLVADAMSIMDQYSTDAGLNKRRLEVRFEGESGFDAASGDEAGVTRGFYADVAEALMSCDVVAGVSRSSTCVVGLGLATNDDLTSAYTVSGRNCKLPLWIPEFDSSGQVIVPTPRAATSSALGIYPRPLSTSHPQYQDVLNTFRFMGRLFAAAMRDGFMFPLPLSTVFLRLVQCETALYQRSWEAVPAEGTTDRNLPTRGIDGGAFERSCGVLESEDLPRPGFLGGEVYAVEVHICQELDRIDHADPPFSKTEIQQEYRRIVSDKTFAQVALGKKYECSFEDYFQDRTFVDPLDPTQGIDAYTLCPNGHNRSVTIHNIREWVALSKAFMLQDGVIGQAVAFRAGVDDFFSSDFLRLFTPEELQSDVCGVGDNVDSWDEQSILKLLKLDGKGTAEALVAVAAIGGNAEALSRRFGPTSGHIKYLIKALVEASPKERRQFLSFVTSVPIVTPGLIEVVPVVSPGGEFMPMRDPSCLPRANTCARRLYLPKFDTFESFAQVLWAVIREESKHKGFFEWSL